MLSLAVLNTIFTFVRKLLGHDKHQDLYTYSTRFVLGVIYFLFAWHSLLGAHILRVVGISVMTYLLALIVYVPKLLDEFDAETVWGKACSIVIAGVVFLLLLFVSAWPIVAYIVAIFVPVFYTIIALIALAMYVFRYYPVTTE